MQIGRLKANHIKNYIKYKGPCTVKWQRLPDWTIEKAKLGCGGGGKEDQGGRRKMRKAQRRVKTELSTRYKITHMFSSPWGGEKSDTTEQQSTVHSMFKEEVCKNVYHANTCQKKARWLH